MTSEALTKQEIEQNEMIEEIINSILMITRTSTVGVVHAFNEQANTVDVQPAIMGKMRGKDPHLLPIIKNCPIHYYGAGGYQITFKPSVGDPCDLVINDRSLDVWKKSGGIVDSGMPRHHDLTDAKAFFGINPYTSAIQSIKDGIDIRTKDGSTSVNIKENLVEVTLGDLSSFVITPNSITLKVGGSAIATFTGSSIDFTVPVVGPSGTFGGKVVETHTHSGVQAGGANTGGPV